MVYCYLDAKPTIYSSALPGKPKEDFPTAWGMVTTNERTMADNIGMHELIRRYFKYLSQGVKVMMTVEQPTKGDIIRRVAKEKGLPVTDIRMNR